MAHLVAKAAGREEVRFALSPPMGFNAGAAQMEGTPWVIVGPQLILLTKDDDELAGILGHEIAHISLGHANSLKTKVADFLSEVIGLTAAGVAGSLLRPSHPSASALRLQREAMKSAYQLGKGLGETATIMTGFTRTQEREADTLGVHFAKAAGFDPGALAEWLTRMEAYQRMTGQSGTVPLFQTHPSFPERVTSLRELAPPAYPWVLWAEIRGPLSFGSPTSGKKRSKIASYLTREECEREKEKEENKPPNQGTHLKVTGDGVELLFFEDGKQASILSTCLPDTIDPRRGKTLISDLETLKKELASH